jgi:hypothetical protein
VQNIEIKLKEIDEVGGATIIKQYLIIVAPPTSSISFSLISIFCTLYIYHVELCLSNLLEGG